LGRTGSANSDVSSFQNGLVDRQSSVTATTSYNETSQDTTLGRSSSFATTIDRGSSTGSYGSAAKLPYTKDYNREYEKKRYVEPNANVAESSTVARNREMERVLAASKGKGPLELHEDDEDEDEYWEDDDEDDDSRFVNFSLLSHIAVRLRDKVPRGTHVKGSIPYPRAFTGKDVVVSILFRVTSSLACNMAPCSQQCSHRFSANF
jgi:RHO1 GDP-GTP exchange protein 1/2